jgi:hypothetical protein
MFQAPITKRCSLHLLALSGVASSSLTMLFPHPVRGCCCTVSFNRPLCFQLESHSDTVSSFQMLLSLQPLSCVVCPPHAVLSQLWSINGVVHSSCTVPCLLAAAFKEPWGTSSHTLGSIAACSDLTVVLLAHFIHWCVQLLSQRGASCSHCTVLLLVHLTQWHC